MLCFCLYHAAWLSRFAIVGPNLGQAETELNWLGDRSWLFFFILVAAAVSALTYGRRMMKNRHLGPKGPPKQNGRARDFDLAIAKLDDLPISTIAAARLGPVHLRGTIVAAASKMGGASGRERIWYNLVGATKDSAAAVEWCVLHDASGQALLVNVGHARVIAPYESDERKLATMALCLGDEVEVLGILEVPGDLKAYSDPNDLSPIAAHGPYGGLLGQSKSAQIKVVAREGLANAAATTLNKAPHDLDE